MMVRPTVLIVTYPGDLLSARVATRIRGAGQSVLYRHPGALAETSVTLRQDEFHVDGAPIGGIFFRAPVEWPMSDGFIEADRSFTDAEWKSVLLAALHLDSVLAINQYPAEAWFENAAWSVWRRKLIGAHVAVAPFSFGDFEVEKGWSWYPYVGASARSPAGPASRRAMGSALTHSVVSEVALAVCQRLIAGHPSEAVVAATDVLAHFGVKVAAIAVDTANRIVVVDTLPAIHDSDTATIAADIISETFNAHLHSW
jgi:hypothetical protein